MLIADSLSPIRLLPSQLADQIAAGEVIERPASVLKELLENALDAGARRVDVELTQGGMEAIRVSDNGHGIASEEMTLAISRHATSKISRLDDLLRLQSLGFRGEALASICSVSEWEIVSRRLGTKSAYALHQNHSPVLLPANHPVGTSVWIRKLFYNTPARRKFLRADRTEFRHCDEVFRRMALARFDVAFYLKHNSRQVHRLPAAEDDIARSRRVKQLCGEAFARNSLVIDFPYSDMRLWGWISKPDYSRQQSDLQYFYINGRIIRDRVINHALRVAYQSVLAPGRHAAFILHLELDPVSVDVNVHPTKHEVRFRQSRLIHDFLIRCLREALQQSGSVSVEPSDLGIQESSGVYTMIHQHGATMHHDSTLPGAMHFGQVLTWLWDRFAVTRSDTAYYLIDVKQTQAILNCRQWQQAYQHGQIKSRPMLIPPRLSLSASQTEHFASQHSLITSLGFDVTELAPDQIILRAIPTWLHGFDSQSALLKLLDQELLADTMFHQIETVLLDQPFDITNLDNKQFLISLAVHRDDLTNCWRTISQTDLSDWLQTRPHD